MVDGGLRRVDARFLLPHPVERAVIVHGDQGWARGLQRTGVVVESRASTSSPPDLCVAPARQWREAVATGARGVILEGLVGTAAVAAAGYHLERFLALPAASAPELLVPLDRPAVLRYVLERWAPPDRSWKALRNRLFLGLSRVQALLPAERVLCLGTRAPSLPFVAVAARGRGIPCEGGAFLSFSAGDDLTRSTCFLFRPDAKAPEWIVKFARVPGYRDVFERDEAGLRLAAGCGEEVARHAPKILHRFQVSGLEASIETAAAGRRLVSLLTARGSHERKLAALDRVVSWLLRVWSQTKSPPSRLDRERQRLKSEVLPQWPEGDAALVPALTGIPAVLQHNDLGSWNIVCDDDSFVVVDWESAVRHGLPLWDLLYLCTDALALLDGALDAGSRREHFRALFRGNAPSSPLLFAWLRRAVSDLGIPPRSVGPIATTCWLHHGLSHHRRKAALDVYADGAPAFDTPSRERATQWLSDPGLGSDWDAWREG